jgi:putative protease
MGCRNTVFSSQAQSGVHSLTEWMEAGASHFRVELVDESPEDTELIVNGYLSVLDGSMKSSALWDSLEHVLDSNGRKGGVSHGSLRNKVERRAGEIL